MTTTAAATATSTVGVALVVGLGLTATLAALALTSVLYTRIKVMLDVALDAAILWGSAELLEADDTTNLTGLATKVVAVTGLSALNALKVEGLGHNREENLAACKGLGDLAAGNDALVLEGNVGTLAGLAVIDVLAALVGIEAAPDGEVAVEEMDLDADLGLVELVAQRVGPVQLVCSSHKGHSAKGTHAGVVEGLGGTPCVRMDSVNAGATHGLNLVGMEAKGLGAMRRLRLLAALVVCHNCVSFSFLQFALNSTSHRSKRFLGRNFFFPFPSLFYSYQIIDKQFFYSCVRPLSSQY